eukprot:Gb_30570 [translate_table: standard]
MQRWRIFGDELKSRNDDLKPSNVKCSGGEVWDELKKQYWTIGPMIVVNPLQYSLQVISLLLVGHLGELALPSASIATAFAGAIGFSMLMGMASALEILYG